MTFYLHICRNCEKKTLHKILMIRRCKGVRLECLKCEKSTLRYYNPKFLKEMTIEEFERRDEGQTSKLNVF